MSRFRSAFGADLMLAPVDSCSPTASKSCEEGSFTIRPHFLLRAGRLQRQRRRSFPFSQTRLEATLLQLGPLKKEAMKKSPQNPSRDSSRRDRLARLPFSTFTRPVELGLFGDSVPSSLSSVLLQDGFHRTNLTNCFQPPFPSPTSLSLANSPSPSPRSTFPRIDLGDTFRS